MSKSQGKFDFSVHHPFQLSKIWLLSLKPARVLGKIAKLIAYYADKLNKLFLFYTAIFAEKSPQIKMIQRHYCVRRVGVGWCTEMLPGGKNLLSSKCRTL